MRTHHLAASLPFVLASAALAQTQSATVLWEKNCMNCHGNAGQGGGTGTQTLLTDELFEQQHDRRFFDAIKKGVPDKGMAAFGETMSDEQMWSLVVHIRELQRDERRKRLPNLNKPGVTYKSMHESYQLETVIDKGLKTPWSVDFIPSGPFAGMLVTNHGGALMLWKDNKLTTIEGTPKSVVTGQGGLMDVEVHPDFAKNGWIYLAVNDPTPPGARGTMTKIVRGKLKAEGDKIVWTETQDIFKAKPEHYIASGLHFGCKIAFDPKDHTTLFFGIGERGQGEMAQDRKRPNGKIHRVKDDGKIPTDNPFANEKDAYPSIWSYGHRNPQGLRFDLDGNLWDTEHGPRGGDELNIIKKGANYGWPIVTFGINYSDAPLKTPWPELADTKAGTLPEITMPVYRWLPSIAVCGLGTATGDAFPKWKGDLFAGGLAGNVVERVRVKVEGGKATFVEHEEIVQGMGRVRDVTPDAQGNLYVTLNGPDMVVRIVPVK